MRALTAGSMETTADASAPTFAAGITSLVKTTRNGARRETAPVLCPASSCDHNGSAGATVGTAAVTGGAGLQATTNSAARARAAQASLDMKSPRVGSRQVQFTGQEW